jgi:hypothetical protein
MRPRAQAFVLHSSGPRSSPRTFQKSRYKCRFSASEAGWANVSSGEKAVPVQKLSGASTIQILVEIDKLVTYLTLCEGGDPLQMKFNIIRSAFDPMVRQHCDCFGNSHLNVLPQTGQK